MSDVEVGLMIGLCKQATENEIRCAYRRYRKLAMVGTSFIAFSSFHAHGFFISMSFVIKTLFVRKFEEMVPRLAD
jgi:hypothetical protein